MLIEYVGTKPVKRDNIAGTTATWFGQGATQEVPDDKAALLLKHSDVWRIAKKQNSDNVATQKVIAGADYKQKVQEDDRIPGSITHSEADLDALRPPTKRDQELHAMANEIGLAIEPTLKGMSLVKAVQGALDERRKAQKNIVDRLAIASDGVDPNSPQQQKANSLQALKDELDPDPEDKQAAIEQNLEDHTEAVEEAGELAAKNAEVEVKPAAAKKAPAKKAAKRVRHR